MLHSEPRGVASYGVSGALTDTAVMAMLLVALYLPPTGLSEGTDCQLQPRLLLCFPRGLLWPHLPSVSSLQ